MEFISENKIKNLLKKRRVNTHKGDYGKVLIVAGSQGMTGAAVLAAKGALRAGSGLVRVSIDKNLFPIVQSAVVEGTCIERKLTEEILKEYDSVVIGPGLGTSDDGVCAVIKIIENYGGNIVVDADALNIVSENHIDLKKAKGNLVITPHPGEAAKLIDTDTYDINSNREKVVSFLADITGAVSVLKGYETLICLPQQDKHSPFRVFKNPTGNPGMATAGSGDVLSGIIGSFLGQGMTLADGTVAGVYVHGYAGDLAAEEMGEYGIIAGDLAFYTAHAIKKIQNV